MRSKQKIPTWSAVNSISLFFCLCDAECKNVLSIAQILFFLSSSYWQELGLAINFDCSILEINCMMTKLISSE
jgi:hypothetical protein